MRNVAVTKRADAMTITDLFTGQKRSKEEQLFDLALGQRIVSHVLGDFCRNLRWLLTGVQQSNSLEQFLSDQVLE